MATPITKDYIQGDEVLIVRHKLHTGDIGTVDFRRKKNGRRFGITVLVPVTIKKKKVLFLNYEDIVPLNNTTKVLYGKKDLK